MIGNNIWPDEARELLLHILPQAYQHQPAEIRGSPEALRRLGGALLGAADLPQGCKRSVEMMCDDGEHYAVHIHPMSDQQMEAGPLPYAQLTGPARF